MRQKDPRPFDKVHPMIARGALNFLLGFVAKTTLRCVYDALKRQIIVRAGDDAEIGHGIANFQPLIESRATDHLIRQPNG